MDRSSFFPTKVFPRRMATNASQHMERRHRFPRKLSGLISDNPPRYPFLTRLNEDDQLNTVVAVHSTVIKELGRGSKADNVGQASSVIPCGFQWNYSQNPIMPIQFLNALQWHECEKPKYWTWRSMKEALLKLSAKFNRPRHSKIKI